MGKGIGACMLKFLIVFPNRIRSIINVSLNTFSIIVMEANIVCVTL